MTERSVRAPEVAREVRPSTLELKKVGIDGVFEGYACLFNREDLGRDIVLPGAFRDTLAERGTAGVKMLLQHDAAQPVGVWLRLHEDARGLYARGRLMTEVAKGREILSLMRAGAIDGLSIGFRMVKGRRDRLGVRRIEKIDLWEISIVTFPMQPEARVTSIKWAPHCGYAPTTREFEHWLMQDAGFSRSQARALMREGIKGLGPLRDAGSAGGWEARILAQMRAAARLLRGEAKSHRICS